MNKVILCCLVIGLMFCAGCGSGKIVKVRLESNERIELVRGQLLKVEVEENPTTGYSWQISGPGESDAVQLAGEPLYIANSPLIGAGGIRTFRFRSLRRGRAMIVFEYKRSWEKYRRPAKKYILTLVVH